VSKGSEENVETVKKKVKKKTNEKRRNGAEGGKVSLCGD
jgi:hypothetical protein